MTRVVPAVLAAIVVLSVSFGGGYGTVAFFSDETTISGEFTAANGFHEEMVGADVVDPDDAERSDNETTQPEPVGDRIGLPATNETESVEDGSEPSVGSDTDSALDEEPLSDFTEPSSPSVDDEIREDPATENATDGESSPEPLVPDDGSNPAHPEHEADDEGTNDGTDADSDGSFNSADDRDGHGVDDDRTDEDERIEHETESTGDYENDDDETESTDGDEDDGDVTESTDGGVNGGDDENDGDTTTGVGVDE